jgi:hypothetical protein
VQLKTAPTNSKKTLVSPKQTTEQPEPNRQSPKSAYLPMYKHIQSEVALTKAQSNYVDSAFKHKAKNLSESSAAESQNSAGPSSAIKGLQSRSTNQLAQPGHNLE